MTDEQRVMSEEREATSKKEYDTLELEKGSDEFRRKKLISKYPATIDAIESYEDATEESGGGRKAISVREGSFREVPVIFIDYYAFPKLLGDDVIARIIIGWQGLGVGWHSEYCDAIKNSLLEDTLKDAFIERYGW